MRSITLKLVNGMLLFPTCQRGWFRPDPGVKMCKIRYKHYSLLGFVITWFIKYNWINKMRDFLYCAIAYMIKMKSVELFKMIPVFKLLCPKLELVQILEDCIQKRLSIFFVAYSNGTVSCKYTNKNLVLLCFKSKISNNAFGGPSQLLHHVYKLQLSIFISDRYLSPWLS